VHGAGFFLSGIFRHVWGLSLQVRADCAMVR